jgi:hypothetical protein
MYSKQWTQFETQSLAYGLLRKALYPKYLVRGEDRIVKIYQPTVDTYNPILLLTLRVEASTSQETSLVKQEIVDGLPSLLIVGGQEAYKVVDHVKPLLQSCASDLASQ